MAAGALLTASYQYELSNGTDALLMGAGTDFRVESIKGLFDLPEITDRDIDRQFMHGAFPGLDITKKRKIIAQLFVTGGEDSGATSRTTLQTNIEANLNLLMRWFQPSSSDLQLSFRRPNAVDKTVFCRPKRREADFNFEVARGKAAAAVQVDCADPRIYELALQSPQGTIPNTQNTVTFNVTPNGEAPTYPVLTIGGPSTNPRIQNAQDTGAPTIAIDVVVPTGQNLVIDTLKKTVLLNGVDSYSSVRTDNKWWKLIQRVANSITYSRSGGGASSTITVAYRSAWL